MQRESLEKLLGLFNLKKKRDIERYCQTLVVSSEDFANLLLAGRVGLFGPFRYQCHFKEISPDHLKPKKHELTALVTNGLGPAKGDALKAVRKMGQVFRERRLLAVHLFYEASQKYWHMFYFDQRDYTSTQNHWKHGPHIHYTQDMFTKDTLALVWSRVVSESPQFPPSVHVRFDYHHNRKQSP